MLDVLTSTAWPYMYRQLRAASQDNTYRITKLIKNNNIQKGRTDGRTINNKNNDTGNTGND